MSCHVMWCNLMCLHCMWCDFLCCVMSRNALRCHVMSSHVLSCHLLWSDAMRSYEFVMHCGWLRCHVVWFEMVVWGELEDDLVIRTTQYYKVLLRYYSVLHSTTPVLLCTTKYYSSTNSVLQSTTPVLLCTRKYYSSTTPVLLCTTKYYSSTTLYYSSTTPYYKVLLQYYAVIQSTTPGLFCTTKYYSSTTLYYKVLLQYHSVLQRTTPVLVCTTKYYSSTTLYYKVLLQYYSVLQSTTPVLVCTTKYYSSTTLYYTELPQYYSVLQSTKYYSSTTLYYTDLHQYNSVLQSTTPVLLCTTKYYSGTTPCTTKYAFARREAPTSPNAVPATQGDSHDWSSSHMKRHLQCAEQQDSSSNVTKYCTCHAKWLSWVMSVTYETSFTLRGATGVIHQRHQVLCLPRKMTRIINPRHTWNVIYNARNNRHHPSTSPNAVPATKNDSHHWSSWHMKRHLQCAEQQASPSNLTKYCACHAKWFSWLMSVTHDTSFTMRGATDLILQHHQILRLPRKIALQKQRKMRPKQLKRQFQCGDDSSMIRAWSDHDPTMNSSSRTRPFAEVTFRASETHSVLKITTFRAPAIYSNFTEYCACHEKWHSNITKCCACHAKWLSWFLSGTHDASFTMRRATDLILQHHQMLRLPRKMTRIIYPRDIWNVIYNARRNRHRPPTSPNTAPATQNDSHAWSSSHMERHLQCAEQQASPSNLTKYCACHAKVHSKI